MGRRIDSQTSRTAEMTCMARAFSALETNPYYKSGDTIAPLLMPNFFRVIAAIPILRHLFMNVVAPKGINEYVIARTKYIDGVFTKALEDHFDQVLIFGAGFDTRGLRFMKALGNAQVFELDVPITQQAKLGQYRKRELTVPANLHFIAIDFDRESLPNKLADAGFNSKLKSLFVLEGLLMYLQPASVDTTFKTINEHAAKGSRLVFDFVNRSVIKNNGEEAYGGKGIIRTVSSSGEQWNFGLEIEEVESFLAKYGMRLLDLKDSSALETDYFTSPEGKRVARINDTHNLVTAEVI